MALWNTYVDVLVLNDKRSAVWTFNGCAGNDDLLMETLDPVALHQTYSLRSLGRQSSFRERYGRSAAEGWRRALSTLDADAASGM